MAEELKRWRMTVSQEMDVGLLEASPRQCGHGEAAGMSPPAAGFVTIVQVLAILCMEVSVKAAFLGKV